MVYFLDRVIEVSYDLGIKMPETLFCYFAKRADRSRKTLSSFRFWVMGSTQRARNFGRDHANRNLFDTLLHEHGRCERSCFLFGPEGSDFTQKSLARAVVCEG